MQTFAQRGSQKGAAKTVSARARSSPTLRNILRGDVQPKLKIGAVNDPAEIEADRVADQVMRMPAPLAADAPPAAPPPIGDGPAGGNGGPPPPIRRKCAACEDDNVQRKEPKPNHPVIRRRSSSGDVGGAMASEKASAAIKSLGSGSPLPASERSFFEPRFGRDLSGVRIHTGGTADEASKAISARAFTLGNNIAFASGEYQPGTQAGRSLMAHEITHALQGRTRVGRVIRRVPCQQTSRYSGNLAHELIEADFLTTKAPLFGAREYQLPGSGPNGGTGYADIVDTGTKDIFEIKTWAGASFGVAELARYIASANMHCGVGWTIGTWYPLTVLPFSATHELVAQQYPQFPGVIVYYTRLKRPPPDPIPIPVRQPETEWYENPDQFPLPFPDPIPVPIPNPIPPLPVPQPVPTWDDYVDQVREFMRRVIETGEDATRAAREFLLENKELAYFIAIMAVLAAIALVIATLVEDVGTGGAGIADDPASFAAAWALVMEARALWAAGALGARYAF